MIPANLCTSACMLSTPAVLAAFGTSAAPRIMPGTSPTAVAAGLALTGNRWGITPMGGGYALVDVAGTPSQQRFYDEVITGSAPPQPTADCGRLPAVWWLRNYRGRSYPASGGRAVAYAAPPAAFATGVGTSPAAIRAGDLGEALSSGTLPGAGMDVGYSMDDTDAMRESLEEIFHSNGFPDATVKVMSSVSAMHIVIQIGSSEVLYLEIGFETALHFINLIFTKENPHLFKPEYFGQIVPAILRLIGQTAANSGFKKVCFHFGSENHRGLAYILYTASLDWSSVYFYGGGAGFSKPTPADIVTAVNAGYDKFEKGLYGIFAGSVDIPSALRKTTTLRQFLTFNARLLSSTVTFHQVIDHLWGAIYKEGLYRNIPGINDICRHPGMLYLLALLTMGNTYIEVPVESLIRSASPHGQRYAAGGGAEDHVAIRRLPAKARRGAPPQATIEFPNQVELERHLDSYLSGAIEGDHVYVVPTTSGHQILTYNPLGQLTVHAGLAVELNVTEVELRRILPTVRRLVAQGQHPFVAIVIYKEVEVAAPPIGYRKLGVVYVRESGTVVAHVKGDEINTSPLPEDRVDGGGVSLSISEVHRQELSRYYALSPPREALRLTYDKRMDDEAYLALLLQDMAENGIMNTTVLVAHPNPRLAGNVVEGLPGCRGNRIRWVKRQQPAA